MEEHIAIAIGALTVLYGAGAVLIALCLKMHIKNEDNDK